MEDVTEKPQSARFRGAAVSMLAGQGISGSLRPACRRPK